MSIPKARILGATAFLFAFCSVHGQEFGGILRDENALGLTPTAASMAMGGAYVGVPGIRSMNPASLAFVEESQAEITGTYWNPDAGPNVYAGRLDLVIPFFFNSHTRLMFYRYGSSGAGTIDNGLDASFESTTLGLQVGIPIFENLAIGFGAYPYEKGKVDLDDPNGTLVAAEASSQLGSLQAGLQWRVIEAVTVGVEGIYIKDELQADYRGSAAGVPEQWDDYYITYLALGASWQVLDSTFLAADFRWGEIEGESSPITPGTTFDQDIERWHIGIEHRPVDQLVLRAGSNYGGLTLGAGWAITDQVVVNYTYVDDAYRDKDAIFDHSRTHTVSVSYSF